MYSNNKHFSVVTYSANAVLQTISDRLCADYDHIATKKHFTFLDKYCREKGVKTVIFEYEYVDRYFVEDYSAYYVRCFSEYDKKCMRVHFFSTEFKQLELENLLGGNETSLDAEKDLKSEGAYKGFVVIKPLPETIVGRTCLESWDETPSFIKGDSESNILIGRPYSVNLFGIELKVKDALAFQEQDRVVAACATSALWSLFHGLKKNNQYNTPSPVQITKSAVSQFSHRSRIFPSEGLTAEMMAQAISDIGLDPYFINVIPREDAVTSFEEMKEYIYAFINCHIPIIFGLDLYTSNNGFQGKHKGKHAVTVTGYSLERSLDWDSVGLGFNSKAHSINLLYVHDDQIGPYADLSVEKGQVCVDFEDSSQEDGFRGPCEKSLGYDFVPNMLIMPNHLLMGLYHKIRIPYPKIREAVMEFDAFVGMLLTEGGNELRDCVWDQRGKGFIWDIHLCESNDLKAEILKGEFSLDERLSLLSEGLPRFIWRARALYYDKPVLDLLFDATDIEQGRIFIKPVEYNQIFGNILRDLIGGYLPRKIQDYVSEKSTLFGSVYRWFESQEQIVEDDSGLLEIFGELRAPNPPKGKEIDGEVKVKAKDPSLIITNEERPSLDTARTTSPMYIWLIDKRGDLHVATEDDGLGHPSIVSGARARIAGELNFVTGRWVVNNKSGRYTRYSPDRKKQHLENAVAMRFEELFDGIAFEVDYDEGYGPLTINNSYEVLSNLRQCKSDFPEVDRISRAVMSVWPITDFDEFLIEFLHDPEQPEALIKLGMFVFGIENSQIPIPGDIVDRFMASIGESYSKDLSHSVVPALARLYTNGHKFSIDESDALIEVFVRYLEENGHDYDTDQFRLVSDIAHKLLGRMTKK
ncbi:hypothetical protein [Neptuniibacter sp.]|uniref:hypothetical protein n=1 Tax=Neptuniibacter sp. TaxID=1962643 RepID=UPI003B59906D